MPAILKETSDGTSYYISCQFESNLIQEKLITTLLILAVSGWTDSKDIVTDNHTFISMRGSNTSSNRMGENQSKEGELEERDEVKSNRGYTGIDLKRVGRTKHQEGWT